MSRRPRCRTFDFNPSDFLNDPNVLVMSFEERGAYITLMCRAWELSTPGVLPADEGVIRRLIGASPEEWDRIHTALRRCFDTTDGHWTQRRMLKEFVDQSARCTATSERKRRAANVRWASEYHARALQQQCPPSSTSFPPTSKERKEQSTHLVPDGTESPFAKGMRLVAKAKELSQETQRLTAEFERLWAKYPHWGRRSLRAASLKRWLALRPHPEIEAVLQGLNAAMASPDWKKSGGEFVPGMQVWVGQHGWDASNGNGHSKRSFSREELIASLGASHESNGTH